MIAVDAMGGDYAPAVVVEGALIAAKKGIQIYLFGDEKKLLSLLDFYQKQWGCLPITIINTTSVITMDEEPTKSVIRKTNSSLVTAMNFVKDGTCQAFVSAGNSGAVLAAATLLVGRASGILRPALCAFLPNSKNEIFCLDLGANTDCKIEYLEQFALIGDVYVRLVKNIARPRIALLSNGHEPYKGSKLVKEVYSRLEKSSLHFVGNIEARDIFSTDSVDVIVCDGFVGNVMLKTAQGTIKTLVDWVKDEAKKSFMTRIILLCSMSLLKKL